MDAAGLGVLLLAMLLGTPTLSLVGAVGAALTLGARRGGVLIPLLVLPLYVPALIFGVGATDAALFGLAARPHLLLLGAVDRKSVVWGKSVSVRVDLGGRRLIPKKKTIQHKIAY